MEQQVTPEQLEHQDKDDRELQEHQDKYDRELADGIDVMWKRHDDLVAYQRLLRHTISNLDAEDGRVEDGGISNTVHYVDSTIEQLREDIAYLEGEWERVTKEIAVIDQLRRILDRSLGGIPLRPRDTLLEGLGESWWGWGSW
jgi:hypothetical protein